MGKFKVLLMLALTVSPAMAQQSPAPLSAELNERAQSVIDFVVNQATLAGAAGVCEPTAYELIHACVERLVSDAAQRIRASGLPDADRAAQLVQTATAKIWTDVVKIASVKQDSGAPPLACSEVLEKARAFGTQQCMPQPAANPRRPGTSGQPRR